MSMHPDAKNAILITLAGFAILAFLVACCYFAYGTQWFSIVMILTIMYNLSLFRAFRIF